MTPTSPRARVFCQMCGYEVDGLPAAQAAAIDAWQRKFELVMELHRREILPNDVAARLKRRLIWEMFPDMPRLEEP